MDLLRRTGANADFLKWLPKRPASGVRSDPWRLRRGCAAGHAVCRAISVRLYPHSGPGNTSQRVCGLQYKNGHQASGEDFIVHRNLDSGKLCADADFHGPSRLRSAMGTQTVLRTGIDRLKWDSCTQRLGCSQVTLCKPSHASTT